MLEKNGSLIQRNNLLSLFDSLSEERAIYVCAPAGYGKTIAAKQWLEGKDHAKAIVALDEYDNNPLLFCERFCAALCACQPENKALAEIVSHPAFGSAPDEFAIRAIAALKNDEKSILVADDLHFVTNAPVLRLLLIFLMRLPDNFQILLISRNDLPPGFSELWMKGRLARIATENFIFSKEEIKQLYHKRGTTITLEEAGDICGFTGGWAIGVNAVLLSGGILSGQSLNYLDQFIRLNVWERWDERTREFMLHTAMARTLSPSLCEALTGISGCDKLLSEMMRDGAFIFRASDGSYRFHHLFQSFLRNAAEERGPEFILSLLEAEGEWHMKQKDFFSAIDCFIRSNNPDKVAECFVLQETNNREHIIERLLPIFQTPIMFEVAQRNPYFYSIMAWAAFALGKSVEMMYLADQFYARYPEVMANDPSHAHFIFLMILIDFRKQLKDIEFTATSLFPTPGTAGGRGSLAMNMPHLHRGTRDFSEFAADDPESNIIRLKALIGWMFGEEADLLEKTLMAGLLYEMGDLEKAHFHAVAGSAVIKKHFPPESKFCVLAILISIFDALKQTDETEKVTNRLIRMIEEDRAYSLDRNFQALLIRRKLANGDLLAAREWLGIHEASLNEDATFYGIYITFTTCRAYITIGAYDSAILLLSSVYELAVSYKRPLDIIEAKILLSIAYWKKKRSFQAKAMQHLEEAVSTASEYQYRQLFINEGPELAGMLKRLQKKAEQQSGESAPPISFIKSLYLHALENQDGGLTSGQSTPPTKFTEKQKVIMKHLCDGKSFREITEIVGIKLPTLRSHIALIYKKLDVTSATDAVIKIKALEVLHDE